VLRRKYGKRVLEGGVGVKTYTDSVYYPEKVVVLGVGYIWKVTESVK
jgi:hypothetical protein